MQPAEEHIDVSIVVAAHNEERLLPRCLDSIQALTGGARIEVIVVDNASTDGTAALARARGVRVLREDTLGAVHAKAAGVRAARGALVAILDADSTCPPDWIARIRRRFAEDEALVGLSGPARYTDAPRWAPFIVWWWYLGWCLLSLFAGRAVYAVGTNVAFRRDAFLRSAGFDTGVLVGGDEIALFSALAKVGRTRFDLGLRVETDGRRTRIGLLRFMLEIAFLRYVVNYAVYRLTGRSPFRRYQPGSTLR